MKAKLHALTLFMAILLITVFTSQAHSQIPYTKGHIFAISLIKILPGQGNDYITSLKGNLKVIDDEAIKEGLLVSSRMFLGDGSNPGDFNFLILDEYADANAAYGNDDKWDAIRQKLVGDNALVKSVMNTRTAQREILGTKTMQEIFFK